MRSRVTPFCLVLPFITRLCCVAGGDWALQRTGAVFIQGTENVIVEDSYFTRLDGIAVMVSAYNRGLIIQRNEVSGYCRRVFMTVIPWLGSRKEVTIIHVCARLRVSGQAALGYHGCSQKCSCFNCLNIV